MVFYGDTYYPEGGINDLYGIYDTKRHVLYVLDQLEDIKITDPKDPYRHCWANIYHIPTKNKYSSDEFIKEFGEL